MRRDEHGRSGAGVCMLTVLAALSSILVLEVLQPFADASAGPRAVEAAVVPAPDVASSGASRLGLGDVLTEAIVARPLFAPSRREQAAAAKVGNVAVAEPPRLSGLIFSPNGARAIFAREGGGATVAEDGSRMGSYVVKSITHEMVLLTGPGGERVLRIAYDPRNRIRPHALQASNLGASE
jgi:hypothetical protein